MKRHPPFRFHRGLKQRGDSKARHAHDQAQLTFVASGTVQVHTDCGRWLVPPQLAVWAPAGAAHRVEVLTDAELWMIYCEPEAVRAWGSPGPLGRAFALRVTPLLRALFAAAFTGGTAPDKAELIVRLVLHELREAPDAPTYLPLPTGVIGRRVAELAFADPRNALDIAALASRAATSVRTVSRLFPAETGLTFKAWRQRARIVHAMDRLAGGAPVSQVSADTGFASTAAFSFAFRQVTATTPTAFLAGQATAGLAAA